MQPKTVYFFTMRSILLALTAFFSPLCASVEKDEMDSDRAFYALSSLCYHLNQILPEDVLESINGEEHIFFEEHEIVSLWGGVDQNDPLLIQAQHYYYLAKASDSPVVSKKLYGKSKELLHKVWKKIGSLLFDNSVQVQEKNIVPTFYKMFNKNVNYPHLENNPKISEEMLSKILPFLIPIDHPIKQALDGIFENSRAIKNEKAFDKAGFETLFIQNLHSFIRVAKHKALPGYLLKVYLDSEPNERAREGWVYLRNRCAGAEKVRELIKRKNIVNFTVPDKWLYVLPVNDSSNPKDQPVLLVVTDMHLVSQEKTEAAWKNKITHKHLDELYCVISHGLASSGLVNNVPYTKAKKFTFIDTEKPKKTPNYAKVRPFLSPEMLAYWDKLVKNGGGGR